MRFEFIRFIMKWIIVTICCESEVFKLKFWGVNAGFVVVFRGSSFPPCRWSHRSIKESLKRRPVGHWWPLWTHLAGTVDIPNWFLNLDKNLKLKISNKIQAFAKAIRYWEYFDSYHSEGTWCSWLSRSLSINHKFARGVGFNSQCVHTVLVFTFFFHQIRNK